LKGSGIGADANVIHVASHFVFDKSNWPESYLATSGPDRFRVGWLEQDLSLVGFDLIALSACGTETVDISTTDAVPTLGSRLQDKGARSVLGTLWNVDDDSAATVMTAFYTNRGATRKMSKSKALISAQAALYRAKPHPFYWAPYVLMGNWQ
jgi:CHAT domain-containing protein